MNQLKFRQACERVIHNQIIREGIGTLQEKTLHAVLKNYYEPDEAKHEIRVGSYVADIVTEKGIIEIQTSNFNTMRGKLSFFLSSNKVTIVYPVPHIKWLYWLDEVTGEISAKRKSPKVGTPYTVFHELYKIKEFLKHPNLCVCIVMLDLEEYRLLNGWSKDKKKGSTRYERIPVDLSEEIMISEPCEYAKMIPGILSFPFTSKDYSKATKLNVSNAQTALNILNYLGVVERIGKKGNAYLYEFNQQSFPLDQD